MSEPGGHLNQQRVRFVAEPLSVPVARRFVTDSVTGSGLPDLAEDAALLVSELSANAALHSGSRYFEVLVQAWSSSVRIGVCDDGSAVAVAARRSRLIDRHDERVDDVPVFDVHDLESTTGRGLVIVSALADRWGVEDTDEGKLVWGELTVAARTTDGAPRAVAGSASAPVETLGPLEPPASWRRVQLVDLPVRLSHEFDQHVQDLVRELQLIQHGDAEWTTEMASLIEGLIGRHIGSWRLSQSVVEQGLLEGRDHVTLDLTVPEHAAADAIMLKEALDLTDRLCERNELLMLAATPEIRWLRAWMTAEFVGQIREGRAPVAWGARTS